MKNFSRSEKKAILRKMEFEAEVKKAISEKRGKYDNISWRGIGLRKIQILFEPAFEVNLGWDIRKQEESYVVYEYEPKNAGYYLLNSEENKLKEIINDLKKVAIPLNLPQSIFGADGTSYELGIFETSESLRLRWWETPHENWKEIHKIVLNAISYFTNLERTKNGIFEID